MSFRNLVISLLFLHLHGVLSGDTGPISTNVGVVKTILGVPPEKQASYQPLAENGTNWSCLNNPEVILDIAQINDGICDCPDGSDEPGTGACGMKGPNFYCANEGFKPRYIPASQVNDGVCDCCDCSDEELAPVPPFSHKTDCQSLRTEFDRIVDKELNEYKLGMGALDKISSKFGWEDPKIKIENLSKEIVIMEQDLAASEERLKRAKEGYDRELKIDNPLLYGFQQLDTIYISDVLNETFNEIIFMSKAYEEIIQILDVLKNTYTKSLNDRVVNSNVKKYNFLKDQKLSKLNVGSEIENEQRQELMNYFQQELPQIFNEGRMEQPVTYLVGKVSFIDMMVQGRTEYTTFVMEAIKQLTEILDDIDNNYNVNYQDAAVKHAVAMYKNWLGRNTRLKIVKLPENFLKEYKKLIHFIQKNSDQIIAPGSTSLDSSLDLNNFGKHAGLLTRKIKQIFKPNLRNQVAQYRETVTQLSKKLEEIKAKVLSIENSGSNHKFSLLQTLISEGLTGHTENIISNYVYDVMLNSHVYQRELDPPQRSVSLGQFHHIQFDDEHTLKAKYMERLKTKYPDELDLTTELISEQDDQQEYLFGNLYQINNGLAISFEGGDKCWNGPRRSVTVFVTCDPGTEIFKVYETTRCSYGIEMRSPVGCNPHFEGFR